MVDRKVLLLSSIKSFKCTLVELISLGCSSSAFYFISGK